MLFKRLEMIDYESGQRRNFAFDFLVMANGGHDRDRSTFTNDAYRVDHSNTQTSTPTLIPIE